MAGHVDEGAVEDLADLVDAVGESTSPDHDPERATDQLGVRELLAGPAVAQADFRTCLSGLRGTIVGQGVSAATFDAPNRECLLASMRSDSGIPWAWAASDTITVNFMYEAA